MSSLFTFEQLDWIHEHATMLGILTVALAALVLWLTYRWLRRHRPGVADAIDGAARDYWAGMGIRY